MQIKEVRYSVNPQLEAVDVARVFDESGIRRPTQDLARIARMFAAPCLVVAAWDGPMLVGVCRSLTDHAYCCYVSDLAIARSHQRLGIGRTLLERTRAEVGDGVTIVLVSAPDAVHYYPRVGFEPAQGAFIVRRKS